MWTRRNWNQILRVGGQAGIDGRGGDPSGAHSGEWSGHTAAGKWTVTLLGETLLTGRQEATGLSLSARLLNPACHLCAATKEFDLLS